MTILTIVVRLLACWQARNFEQPRSASRLQDVQDSLNNKIPFVRI